MEEILRAGFAELGLPLDAEALRRFRSYYEYLTERNREIEPHRHRRRGADRAAALPGLLRACWRRRTSPAGGVIDVGSGAGFPGLPLKIASHTRSRVTLLDSLGKRTDFCARRRSCWGWKGVTVVCARAEEAPPELRGGL